MAITLFSICLSLELPCSESIIKPFAYWNPGLPHLFVFDLPISIIFGTGAAICTVVVVA
jgi:hypothetical protein